MKLKKKSLKQLTTQDLRKVAGGTTHDSSEPPQAKALVFGDELIKEKLKIGG
ncbi:hypothetical protein [Pseudoalteromonas luteoviolacea]|uniref:hypothetical protein n=1 Tax=Pseudoalteromonas luteoviolacea TaxID=43657 RepID=UPI00159F295A|nr:hypothetical protein [Pseudoalteromonas luteoviolacea]